MRKQVIQMSAITLTMICGSTAALAQDSVGLASGNFGVARGDAVRPHSIADQCNNYVVDLAALTGSWGTAWGIAPIAKSSQFVDAGDNSAFFNGLTSSQFLSSDMLTGQAAGGTFEVWSTPGAGVNHEGAIAWNSVPGTVNGPVNANQLGYMFSEFGNTEDDTIVGGLINWDPADNPGRLYLSRTNAAISGEVPASATFSTFGVGSIDANGNLYFRADDFGRTGLLSRRIGAQWIYRIDAALRDCNTMNVIDNTNAITSWFLGDGDVAGIHDEAVTHAPVFPPTSLPPATPTGNATHVVPNCVPESLVGGVPSVLTSTFNTETVFGGSAGPGTAGATLMATVATGLFDIRGSVEFTSNDMFTSAASVHTAGMLTKVNANDASTTRITIWGIDGAGAPSGPGADFAFLDLPTTISDPCDNDPVNGGPFQLNRVVPANIINDYDGTVNGILFPAYFYDSYHGAAAFRGVNSQVALGRDSAGNNLVAAQISYSAIRDDDEPGNAIVVTKFGEDGVMPMSVLAAWNNYPGTQGKPIYDGPAPGGVVIGELCSFEDMGNNNLRALGPRAGNAIGPSLSPAGFDSYGNLYFTSAIQIFRGANQDNDLDAPLIGGMPALFPFVDTTADGLTDSPNPERDLWEIGLVRAVYDQANFCYRLELVMRTGQVFPGQNSGTNYMIDNIQISGGFSAAAGIFGSGNVNEQPMHGVAPAVGTPAEDPRHLGGLVVMADIIYDVDGLNELSFPPVVVASLPMTSLAFDALGLKDFPEAVGGTGAYEDLSVASAPLVPLYVASTDQSYQSLLFIGNEAFVAPPTCTPCSNVDGSLDLITNLADLNVVLFNFGASGNTPGTNGDTDCDGDTDLADLNNVLFNFGANVGC